MKTGVQRAGIYQVGHAQLLDIPQTLKVRVFNQIEHQLGWYTDKSVNRVVYNFLFIQCVVYTLQKS